MTHPLPPTAVLPALSTLHDCSAAHVGEALQALREVCFPYTSTATTTGAVPVLKQSLSEAVLVFQPKRRAHLIHHDGVPDSGYASAEEDEQDDRTEETRDTKDKIEIEEEFEALDKLRLDEFERDYAIKWLTGLVKRGDAWVCWTSPSEEQEARTKCFEDASRLLARFASDDAPEEALIRTFVFPLRMPSCGRCRYRDVSSIMVELNDAPVDGTDHTAVGLQSWGSAIVFAERMCLDPERYFGALHCCTSKTVTSARPRRLLELGAGTGLLSITAAQILSWTSVRARIKATDYHPNVLANLARNVQHNRSAVDVSVEKLDWCAVPHTESIGVHVGMNKDEGGREGLYDIVLAADVVYYPEHANWIRACVGRTLKRDGVFWLIIPVRAIGRHEGLGETVEEAFPVAGDGERTGEQVAIVSKEYVGRVDGVGRADEGGYTLFEIRWV